MEQYISKSALVAEINRVLNSYDPNEITSGRYALVDLLSFIDTLEVKEVDLEKELDSLIIPELKKYKALPSLMDVAKHFFELGLLLQTETNITFKYNIGESVREYKAQKEEKA